MSKYGGKVLIQKINALIWFQHKEEEQLNGRLKKLQGAEGAHSPKPQKAHPTSEFTIVIQNRGRSLLRLVSTLVTRQ